VQDDESEGNDEREWRKGVFQEPACNVNFIIGGSVAEKS
jgi:hypothetical protein